MTFGVETPGGVVYGEPYTFSLAQNDFSLLEDEKWFLLSDKNFKSGDALLMLRHWLKGLVRNGILAMRTMVSVSVRGL